MSGITDGTVNGTDSLEKRVGYELEYNHIKSQYQESINGFLYMLKEKDEATYCHSMRVGLLASRIGRYMGMDSKALLFAGLLHDIGKIDMPLETLTKHKGFTAQDMQVMKGHVKRSYQLLKDVHPFTAEIALRHHRYQEKGYPSAFPPYNQKYGDNTKALIDNYARIVALADTYDAMSTRQNDQTGGIKLSPDEVKARMLQQNPDLDQMIKELYKNRIL